MNAKEIIDKSAAVIFDLDGVLVDTAVFHYQAWRHMAKEFNFDFTEAENEQLKGVSRVESLELILKWAEKVVPAEEKERLARMKNTWYLELIDGMKNGDVLPGTIALLTYLRGEGKKIALGSASKNAVRILEKTGILDYFDAIIDGNAVTRSKPDPEVFLKAAEAIGILPADCVVFEDAQAGIAAARSAGMAVIAVDKAHALTQYDARVNGLSDLSPNVWA
ncbi:beta-phosphoglucomutase [Sphingobacterium allocomposti]|uniref:Beta-phosphoglucomutase n=1 Tax=Sphingobacterium allocomposti TaxID=415956 RepID=A0A5S5DPG2_9SPHI|nr:beta-phosphoglucomutase [Sphingobacterium composti Yoo et al. 2007 non Ten et al. 2007]TYP97823.1 beta-phosphoglucomutase [Sphingobacterium composti Yoo et al. 2007 non Ten et al. 2007]